GLQLVAVDQDRLVGLLREGVERGLVGMTGLAYPGFLLVEHLQHAVTECEGYDHERQPPKDGLLAVLSAPAPHAGGEVALLGRRRLLGLLRRRFGLDYA